MTSKIHRILNTFGLKKFIKNTRIVFKELNPLFGAKITAGFDLKNIDQAGVVQLKALLKEKGMLVIPSHRILSDKEQIKLTSLFGSVDNNISYISPHSKIKDKRTTTDKVYLSSALWHCDEPYIKNPPHVSVFQMLDGTNQKWGTEFIDLYQVCSNIGEEDKHNWVGLNIMYSGDDVTHPLLHIHPFTGKQSLYFDFRFAKEVFNYCLVTGKVLIGNSNKILSMLNELFSRHTTNYYHRWSSGDIVIIDNYAISRRENIKPEYNNSSLVRRTTTKGVYF